MEPANNLPTIRCPLHPSEAIQRVDLNFNSQKQLYCVECMLRADNSRSSLSHLVSIQDFISKAAISYLGSKHKVRHISDPPGEYLEVLARQGETMDMLSKHIEEEKAKVQDVFNEITNDVIKIIESKKNEYLNTLDDQILNLSNHYNFFEKQLKRGYFKQEDAVSLFPTKDELNTKLSKIENANQLSTFVKSIKEDLNQDKCGVNFLDAADESIKAYLDSLVENLNDLETIKPIYENQKLDIHQVVAEVKRTIDNLLEQAFILRNPILNVPSSQTYPESSILKPDDFKLIRTWLSSKFSFTPRLLYRASRDGMSPEPFHSKCDGKGATVTVIKCEFNGSAKTSIIGGFLDKDWHQKRADILSNEAFLFSVTTRVKCPISQPQYAAHGRGDSGPVFGGGCDILVTRDLAQCYMNPLSYSNAAGMVESEKYPGSGSIKFVPLDIEVYALK